MAKKHIISASKGIALRLRTHQNPKSGMKPRFWHLYNKPTSCIILTSLLIAGIYNLGPNFTRSQFGQRPLP